MRGLQVISQLQSVLKELLEVHSDDQLSELCDQALHILEDLPPIDCSHREGKTVAMQLHGSGISLWNKTVALKSAGAISLSLNAQMRHISCTLVLLSNPLEPSETNILKQITMATKTGRAWLDCDNPTMAETSLTLASDCWEKLREKFPTVSTEPSKTKSLFRVLCFRTEACVGLEQHDSAMAFMQQAKELLRIVDSETAYIAMLCYNFGLDQFQKGPNENCIAWLKESYEIGRGCPNLGAVKQARTLRLLANAFLELDGASQWQKALNAVSLANSEHSHPAGFLLKTSILVQYDSSNERLGQVYEATLEHPELSVEMGLSAIRLASHHNRTDLSFSGLSTLVRRFANSPEIHRIHLLHLELLLENGQLQEAKQLVEDCITAHNTGTPIDRKFCKQFHLILWEQASQASEKSEHNEAVLWYNYSLSLFPADAEKDKNIAKLQRNRCSCYLHLDEHEKAREAIEQAKAHDPDSSQTHFLIFKLALLLGQQEEAVASLNSVSSHCSSQDTVNGFICLAAQLAFEHSNRELAVQALEKLVRGSSDPQLLTALRCLIRLKLSLINSEASDKIIFLSSLLSYIQTAHSKLSLISSPQAREKEAVWFLKVAWNLALQCGDNYQEMRDFFIACYSLSECVSVNPSVLLRQKTCQLMAAAASVHMGRKGDQDLKISSFKSVLDHVQKCRDICKQLGGGVAGGNIDPTPSLLALYEFEAKLELGHPDLDTSLTQITSLPGLEIKTLETIAALCVRGNQQALAVQALKLAIQEYLKSESVDGEKLSKCYHSLVQLVMGSEGSRDLASKEQAWSVLTQVLDLLETRAKSSFPEMEVLWLLAKTWNCGIHLYSSLRFKEAERWCSMGMRFLKHLTKLKSSYEDQINTVYSKVLQKVQSDSIHFHLLQ